MFLLNFIRVAVKLHYLCFCDCEWDQTYSVTHTIYESDFTECQQTQECLVGSSKKLIQLYPVHLISEDQLEHVDMFFSDKFLSS